MKLGHFPLPRGEAERIRLFLAFPNSALCSALDPCIGDGGAFAIIAEPARRYGIELDAHRAEQARSVTHEVIQGNAFDAYSPVESYSLLYLNPPCDFECGDGRNRRMEQVFLDHFYRWLRPGGVLVLVVPGDRLKDCDEVLATHFKNKSAYRLTEGDSEKYKQVVLFAVRRTRREREQLRDAEVGRARHLLGQMSRGWRQLPPLPDHPDAEYAIPAVGPAHLVYRGLPLDEIEDLLAESGAYRQAARILCPPQARTPGRPLTPLHAGHFAILAVGSMLDGVFGSGEDRHVAAWRTIKVIDRSEEVKPDGTIIQRERERFTNEVTFLYASGKTAILH
jgi:SAM-dependent methyltransferase